MSRVNVLDHGYIEMIEHWGSDERIVEAARMSTDKGFLGDEKLLRYLYENKHATPFEMAGLVIEVQAPIMVFREWHRHRTQSYNELSARYTPLPNLNYIPTVERLLLLYEKALMHGVPKELARIHLPVGRYSRMRASANLRNWLAFLTLRMDEKAQWEIRQYANEVGKLIADKFPRTWELFSCGR